MDGSKNIPGRAKDSEPGVPIQPSDKHHIIEIRAVIDTWTAVIGSA
jgi:hypothetical protein